MRIGIEAQRLLRPHKHEKDIVALEIIHALGQIDHENEYFIFVRPDEDEACLQLQPNFTLVKLPALNYVHWEQIVLPRAIRSYRLDVLHCTADTSPVRATVPLILTVHDMGFLAHTVGINTATLGQRLENWYRALLVHQVVNRCQTLLTVSRFTSDQIKNKLNVHDKAVGILYNGVNSRFGAPIPADQLRRVIHKYQLPSRYFLFLGSTDLRKNGKNVFLAFVQYARYNKDVRLVVSGKLPPYLKQILSADEYACVLDRCQSIGYIPNADLPALYTLAEIFLFPSISEGVGLPILEAMACGTPVITSTLTAMPEVAGEAALLVDPHQPDQIADAMGQLTDKALLRQSLIQRGKERVAFFSWARTAQQLLSIYKRYDPVAQSVTPSAYSIA